METKRFRMRKFDKMNKKADSHEILSPEVIKITLAIMCLLLLVYLGYKLASIFIDKHRIDQAKAVLEDISGKISSLKKQGDSAEYSIRNPPYEKNILLPDEWWILTVSNPYSGMPGDVPKECREQKCACLEKSKKEKVCKSINTGFSLLLQENKAMISKIELKDLPIKIKIVVDGNYITLNKQ